MIVAMTPHLKWEIILGNNFWEENPALKDILFDTSPVQRDQRFDFQPSLQNFEKRALAESNHAIFIKSTAGGKMAKIHYGKHIHLAEAMNLIRKAGRRPVHRTV